MTCACTETSRAETGSSATMSLGSTDSARAMPMRWRWPPENSCGYFVRAAAGRPTAASSSRSRFFVAGAVGVQAVRPHPLDEQRLDRLARVQAAHRVLEDHLDVLAAPAQLLTLEGGDVGAVDDDAALGRGLEVEDRLAERRLAAAGLADEPVGLAPADLQVDAVDGVDVADDLVEDDAPLDREVHLDAAHVDEDVALVVGGPGRGWWRCRSSGHLTGLWQRRARRGVSSSCGVVLDAHLDGRWGSAVRRRRRGPTAGCRPPTRGWG